MSSKLFRSVLVLGTTVLVLALLAAGVGVSGILFDSSAVAQPPDPTPGATSKTREQNLDANGFVRVHEQGTANVNVQNTPLDVQGSVSVGNFPTSFEVSNFPAVQDVAFAGGVGLSPMTTVVALAFQPMSPGDLQTQNFATVNAVSILISDIDDEIEVRLHSPLTGDFIFAHTDLDGGKESSQLTFVHPLPVNGVTVGCANESEDCHVFVSVMGF